MPNTLRVLGKTGFPRLRPSLVGDCLSIRAAVPRTGRDGLARPRLGLVVVFRGEPLRGDDDGTAPKAGGKDAVVTGGIHDGAVGRGGDAVVGKD
jgi:hypothetical protein